MLPSKLMIVAICSTLPRARAWRSPARITLQPGQEQEVTFTVGRDERNYYSAAKNEWVVEPSDFDVWVGNSSAATLHDSFAVVER
jgi:hypothetical protein